MISFGKAASSHSGLILLKTAYKKMPVNNEHKIRGKNWSYLRPYLKAFLVFKVLETCRVYLLTIDLGIVKFIKKVIKWIFSKCEICRHGPNYVQNL